MIVSLTTKLLKELLKEVVHISESTEKVERCEEIISHIDTGNKITLINIHLEEDD